MRLEDRIRYSLNRKAEAANESESAWRTIQQRLDSGGRSRRRIGIVLVAMALSVGAFSWVWIAFRPQAVTPGIGDGQESSPPRPAQSVRPRVAALIDVGGYPAAIGVGGAGIWVSVPAQGPDSSNLLLRIDPETNAVTQTVRLDMPVDDLAVGPDAVWAVGANVPGEPNLIRIDPVSGNTVATFTGIGGPIAVDSGSVWATTREGSQWSLVTIDAATKQATTIPLDGLPYSVAVDGTAVWVLETNTGNGSGQNASKLVHVSADSGQVVGVIPVDVAYPMIAAGLGEVWVSQATPEGSTAIRIDATSNSQEGEPVPVATLFRPFAVAEGGVWFIAGPGQEVAGSGICRLNAETSKVDICIDPGTLADPLVHAVAIDSATGVLWVANYRGSVTRVDLA